MLLVASRRSTPLVVSGGGGERREGATVGCDDWPAVVIPRCSETSLLLLPLPDQLQLNGEESAERVESARDDCLYNAAAQHLCWWAHLIPW